MASFDTAIAQGAALLRAAGIDTPQREARLLMALASGLSTTDLMVIGDRPAPPSAAANFDAYLARRAAREPYQHIAGLAHFYGADFICDARALIPRPDSECVVDLALERLPRGGGHAIADLGTGSGCLMISILKARGGVTGIGLDADPRAASLARENVNRHQLGTRAQILTQSWTQVSAWRSAALIISNPPYIETATLDTLDPEVRLFDPVAALDGGPDGLAAYRDITALAALNLKPGAVLVFEIGHTQRAAVEALLAAAGFAQIQSRRDLGGRDRAVSGVLTRL
jgi:release factor glutamine methyltransferase